MFKGKVLPLDQKFNFLLRSFDEAKMAMKLPVQFDGGS